MKKTTAKTTEQAIKKYYLRELRNGEIKATGPKSMELAEVFPSFLACDSKLKMWARIMRGITGKTIEVFGRYKVGEKVKDLRVEAKIQKKFFQELRILKCNT